MSTNSILKGLRQKKHISKTEVAFKIGCSIMDINNIETEGYPITGELFLRLLSIYSTKIEEVIFMKH